MLYGFSPFALCKAIIHFVVYVPVASSLPCVVLSLVHTRDLTTEHKHKDLRRKLCCFVCSVNRLT